MIVQTILAKLATLGVAAVAVSPPQASSLPVEVTKVGAQVGKPWTGAMGITESVAEIQAREDAIPASERSTVPRLIGSEHEVDRKGLKMNPYSPFVSQWPPMPKGAEALISRDGGPKLPQTIGTTFDGPTLGVSFALPPDSQGAPGPTQFLVFTNGRIRVYDKTGVLGSLNVSADTFWTSVKTPGQGTSDPRVRFDRLTNRWILCMIDVATPNRVLIAVSDGPTITSTSNFTFFQFQQDLVTPTGNTGELADYPTLGVDKNALYIGTNNFGASFTSTTGFVVRKSSVLGAGPIVVTAFRNLAVNGGAGPFTPQGVDNDDPNATEGYFIGVDNVAFGKLVLRRVTDPGGTPSISGNINITVPATNFPKNVAALGSTQPLDALEDRLFRAEIRLNRNTGIRSLWTAHNIGTRNDGVSDGTSGNNTRTSSRFYEIRNFTATPTLTQSGTLFSTATTNPDSFWIPSVAMSGQGHMALGASAAGGARRAEIVAAGRLVGDTLGTIQAPTTAQTTTFNYNAQTGVTQRWGDYSQTSVDPVDDMTMWTVQEYCNATDSWAVRVVQLKAPPPATIASISPTSITQGQTTNIILTGTSTSGSGWFDPGAGFTGRLAASVSGTGVTVNSVTYTSPTSVTLNVTAAANATTGLRSITVTNPDGQALTKTSVLTVAASGVPTLQSVSISPTSVTNGTPATGTVTLTSAPASAFNVAVSSSNNAVATVVSPVTVPGGQTTRNFTISTKYVAADTVVTITGTRNGVVRTANLTVKFGIALEALYVLPSTVVGGTATNGIVSVTTVSSAPFNIALSSSNIAVATVATPITVAAGTTTKLFTINTLAQASTKVVTITASRNGVVKTQSLTVTP